MNELPSWTYFCTKVRNAREIERSPASESFSSSKLRQRAGPLLSWGSSKYHIIRIVTIYDIYIYMNTPVAPRIHVHAHMPHSFVHFIRRQLCTPEPWDSNIFYLVLSPPQKTGARMNSTRTTTITQHNEITSINITIVENDDHGDIMHTYELCAMYFRCQRSVLFLVPHTTV